MTGLHVVRVDVHVQNVSFEKENKALQAGVESAALESGTAEKTGEEAGNTAQAEPTQMEPGAYSDGEN